MYNCMIDFVYGNLYLLYVATYVYNKFYFLQLLFKCVKTLFLWQFVYKLMFKTTYYFFTTYVYDILYLLQLMWQTLFV